MDNYVHLYYTMAQPRDARAFACRVLGCCEQDIHVAPNGKPYLPDGPHFSISHSGGMVLLAVSDSPVGCDVEPANRTVKNEAAIRRKLFPDEDNVPFLQLWTAYEARLKSGLGDAAEIYFPDIHENFICAVAAPCGEQVASLCSIRNP
ncbi:MAG: hypothetical protein FWD06_05350 [Oscillospiraceae bacterium]|nr:hypothetical protein [Oscillospiraceae bacterium]